MKKIILFFSIATLVLVSCSKDDSPSQDKFIGTWTKYQYFENGVEETLSTCDKKDKIVVSADGSLLESYYYDNNGTCQLDGEDQATWENLGNGNYKISYDVSDFYQTKITFEGNTFITEDTEIYNGQTETYKYVYIRN